jgi:hypothetical protein
MHLEQAFLHELEIATKLDKNVHKHNSQAYNKCNQAQNVVVYVHGCLQKDHQY